MELMDQIVQNFMRDIGMNLWQEYSEKLESYHAFRRTELFTRFRDEYSKRKQQQERRNVMTRWNAGGSTQSTAGFDSKNMRGVVLVILWGFGRFRLFSSHVDPNLSQIKHSGHFV